MINIQKMIELDQVEILLGAELGDLIDEEQDMVVFDCNGTLFVHVSYLREFLGTQGDTFVIDLTDDE